MMTPFVFNTTPSLVFEPGAARRLGALCGTRLGDSVLFVTDAGLRLLDLCDPALESLRGEGRTITAFDGVESDPSRATLMRAVEAGREAGVSGVVGLGGGSSLDVAKLAALLLGSGEDLDQAWGVASRELVKSLAPDSIDSLELALADPARAGEVADRIREIAPDGTLVTDWRELNRELFAALRLQQLALFLLLGLIVLVSTFNVASTLVVLVRERLRDLGVLAAMGLAPSRLRRVFLLYGGALGVAGAVLGLAIAFAISWAANRFELVRFGPDVASIYFLRAVPFRLALDDALAIAGFTVGVTFLSCWLPSRRALKLDPAAALRFE